MPAGEKDAMKTLAAIHNLHADTLELPGDCGHFSFICENEALRDKVNNFME